MLGPMARSCGVTVTAPLPLLLSDARVPSVRDDRVSADAPDPRREDALRAAALRGDERAWSALVARHDRRVVLSLLAWGVRADRARDLAQAAWLRLWEQQQRGALRALELPGLAITQARFLARDDLRARSHPTHPLDEGMAVPDPAPDAEARATDGERVRRAEEALRACHPTAQRVFLAVYDDPERPQAEVAREVGLSLQRVRQIVCEVRKKLRAALDGDPDE